MSGGQPPMTKERDISKEKLPRGNGPEVFDTDSALQINSARMAHLEGLRLTLEGKSVLDVGCGVGRLAQFFVAKGCKVVCVDVRDENIAALRSRYPGIEAHTLDVERASLANLGLFDVVFAYGLLYHLENPLMALRNMESVCKETLILETVVCDSKLPLMRLADETLSSNQGAGGLGCRPSPSFVVMALNRIGFRHVYSPKTPPEHPDFKFQWRDDLEWNRDGHLTRSIFIASRNAMDNPNLMNLLAGRTVFERSKSWVSELKQSVT